MRHEIVTITPSRGVNRELKRFCKGLTTWEEVDHLIRTKVREGLLGPDTNPDVIKRVALETYLPDVEFS